MEYRVKISGEAGRVVAQVAREEGLSPGEVVSLAFGCRKWLVENVGRGTAYVKTRSRFGGEVITLSEVAIYW